MRADPAHPDALGFGAAMALERGRPAEALALIDKALALASPVSNPPSGGQPGRELAGDGTPGLHYRRALACRALGRTEEAIASYRAVIRLQPGHLAAHNNLARALHERGELEEAASLYRKALALGPDPRVLCNLGNLLLDRGRFDEAASCYERARSLAPDLPEIANGIGSLLLRRGRSDAAIAPLEAAVAARPDAPEFHANLARAQLGADRPGEALAAARRSLALADTAEARRLFVACARAAPVPSDRHGLDTLMQQALTEGWGRARDLARFATALLLTRPEIAACIARAPALDAADIATLARDSLLIALLEATPIVDRDLERTLTAARSVLLSAAIDALPFWCALASQCFLNEHVFVLSDADRDRAAVLRAEVAAAIESGAAVFPLALVALASVVPLHALPNGVRLLDRSWPEPVAALLAREVAEPAEEDRLRDGIPSLTPVVNTVSRVVQAQYEDNPYPRWRTADLPSRPVTLAAHLSRLFPTVAAVVPGTEDGIDILVAGCGTGQQSIELARTFRNGRVLAIDLSRASLAYARRQTAALGIGGIEYAQADLLELGALDRRFDLIAASGVLHHLEDPFAGWRALLALLRPRGVMCVGLYSEIARRDVVAARAFIAAEGYRPTPADIRRCRQVMLHAEDGSALRRLSRSADFASMSGCRDLLFHAQEHRLTLPAIAEFLSANGLDFLGFDLPAATAAGYRARFPEDRPMTDLDRWHEFEQANPGAFANMYQFWVQTR